MYHEGEVKANGAWIYLAVINTISQAVCVYVLMLLSLCKPFQTAIHSLIYFYKATKHLLKPMKPISKFLCIKSIVFFAFWLVYLTKCTKSFVFSYSCRQSILIALLVKIPAVRHSSLWKNYSIDNVQTGLQVIHGVRTCLFPVKIYMYSRAIHFSFFFPGFTYLH